MGLRITDLRSGYGGVNILWGINVLVDEGQCVALVGSNGAGKSTLLKTIAGLLSPAGGKIVFDGTTISGLKSSRIVEYGISMVPEGYKLFRGMTVEENLRLGAYKIKEKDRIEKRLAEVYEIFPELRERRRRLAGNMSGGQQQMCSIGRGLMAYPKLLMVDELSLGLAPMLVELLVEKIIQIREKTKMSVLLVEQDVEIALSIADYGYVIESGKVVLEGDPAELLKNQSMISSYLGL
jgi:branched-chain amino acid transport system ATP-binding protein